MAGNCSLAIAIFITIYCHPCTMDVGKTTLRCSSTIAQTRSNWLADIDQYLPVSQYYIEQATLFTIADHTIDTKISTSQPNNTALLAILGVWDVRDSVTTRQKSSTIWRSPETRNQKLGKVCFSNQSHRRTVPVTVGWPDPTDVRATTRFEPTTSCVFYSWTSTRCLSNTQHNIFRVRLLPRVRQPRL